MKRLYFVFSTSILMTFPIPYRWEEGGWHSRKESALIVHSVEHGHVQLHIQDMQNYSVLKHPSMTRKVIQLIYKTYSFTRIIWYWNTHLFQEKSGMLCSPEANEMIFLFRGDIYCAPWNAAARNTFRGPKSTEYAFWKPSSIAIIVIFAIFLSASYLFRRVTCADEQDNLSGNDKRVSITSK